MFEIYNNMLDGFNIRPQAKAAGGEVKTERVDEKT